jgi:membrane associated rhomboid family serine protease
MVMPIGDDNADRRRMPLVNYALIAINVFVFIVPQGLGENAKFTFAYACVPQEIITGKDAVSADERVTLPTGQTAIRPGLQPTPLPQLRLTLWSSIFMHGSIAHLLGNMLFLWIFGDNVEDRLGHIRYLIFYLVCGLIASFAHIATTYIFKGDPLMPSLGASGAISGVLSGYVVLFPHRRVTVILLRMITQVPAWVAIGIWFLLQIVNSIGIFGSGAQAGGIAYGAHIGGFIAGLLLVKPFAIGTEAPPRFRTRTFGRSDSPWQ